MHRTEYPRPQFVRKDYLILNGTWQFDFDDNEVSLKEKWQCPEKTLSKTINVPFCFESKLSGISDSAPHNTVFYKRKFEIPIEWKNKRVILHFGAVDYRCKVFVNGNMVGEHEGGHISFSFDITDYLTKGEQDLSVYVNDPFDDETIPRGKQFWLPKSGGIWYTRTTGIWQTVWLEPVNEISIKKVKFTPDIDEGNVKIEGHLSKRLSNLKVNTVIKFGDEIISDDTYSITKGFFVREVDVFGQKIFNSNAHGDGRCWTPENPNLFDITLTLLDGETVLDEVKSYFGMRKVHTQNGMVYLNNRPYYLKLVLDQGYWPEGLLTAPKDEDFVKDIELAKAMGFNGCRKHQKVEDPRFMYWADKMGFIVWGEMAASCVYTDEAAVRLQKEWMEIIDRDYNHPSIIAWVPLNESWGVSQIDTDEKQKYHSLALYHQIKSVDTTRLVVNNDGWEMTRTDICAIHNYHHGGDDEPEKYEYFKSVLCDKDRLLKEMPAGRHIFAQGYKYEGQPILLTEFGGIGYDVKSPGGWGYTLAKNEEEFLGQYKRVIDAVLSSDVIFGFCYTQLTDVEQEINGLLTYDRQPKCDVEKIKEINSRWRHNISYFED